MCVSVRVLDDGAWISIDGTREVGVSDLWQLAEHEFCPCETADVLLEGFFDSRQRGDVIEARPTGRCIVCGERGSIGWLTIGHVKEGQFVPVDPSREHRIESP